MPTKKAPAGNGEGFDFAVSKQEPPMPFINAVQLRVGMIVNFEGELCRVTFVEHQTPGNLPARIATKMKRLKDGINRENRFGSSEKIDKVSLEQHQMEYLYEDGDNLVFMNGETYEQIELNKEILGDDVVFLQPNMQVEIEFNGEEPLSATLPASVVLEIVDTEPVMKNANATGSYKPAKLENGVTVNVPPYIEAGEKIRVNTVDRTYMERVK
jgi:elongation factor P